MSSNTIKLNGSNYLRQRLILSTLSGKNLKITKIREADADPGLVEYEMNLLRMLEMITNGTTVKAWVLFSGNYVNMFILKQKSLYHFFNYWKKMRKIDLENSKCNSYQVQPYLFNK